VDPDAAGATPVSGIPARRKLPAVTKHRNYPQPVKHLKPMALGTDRAEMLRFACQFTEFGGWVFQDAADLVCAMHWTDRALDYALELGDQRVIAYTLMRKAMGAALLR
jgi:hypothetical protein